MRFLTPLLLLSTALAAGAGAAPQGGGFTPGELVLHNSTLNGIHPQGGAIVRLDPTTGTVTPLLDITGQQSTAHGMLTYDPYRERVLFSAVLPTPTDPWSIWAIDAAGNLTDLGVNRNARMLTPGAGGRVYFNDQVSAGQVHYIDAANVQHTLMDASGTQPWTAPGWTPGQMYQMRYDPGLNALFIALRSQAAWTCSTINLNVAVHRVPLSADGARVEGPLACAEFPLGSTGGEPMSLSRGPDGSYMVVVDTNENGLLPRMTLVDPVTMATTTYAQNDHANSNSTRGGLYSNVLQQALILDTANDVIRLFSLGQQGPGTVVVPSAPFSNPSVFHDTISIVEIPLDGRGSLVGTYCTAKLTSGGCLPEITTSGEPEAGAASGFVIQAGSVEPGNLGLFFYGTSGAAALPFLGGTLCVGSPITRTPPTGSGGAAACSGAYSIDFNAYVATGLDPALVAGAVVHGQFWFRDPPHPVGASGLSGGVAFTLCP